MQAVPLHRREVEREFGSAINRAGAPLRNQAPTTIAARRHLEPGQIDAKITIALVGNERRTLLIAIAVVIAMMATILAM
ncbi:MAG: hypothetical protein JNJ94_07860 [Chlorobi bacterium]|nr:hypothetical protein [Chlorobiota bacterium]